jgi:hypothetical protein
MDGRCPGAYHEGCNHTLTGWTLVMVDPDTFLTGLYVVVDEYCKAHSKPARCRGRPASLARSEVVTLALFGQWGRFASERDFYRYADRRLRGAFPRLPDRGQLNRRIRAEHATIVAVGHHLAAQLGSREASYEVLDATAAPVRNVKRRGGGWLPEYAARGWSNRLGWYEGFHLLVAATPDGIITGYGIGPADAKEQPLAEAFFAARSTGDPRLAMVGRPVGEPYVADSGFIGADRHAHWLAAFGARVLCPPYRSARRNWPRALRRWLAGRRQVIESVNARLLLTFRLDRERPHDLGGFHARLAAKVALHNFCCWLNRQLGRPTLAFADLLAW